MLVIWLMFLLASQIYRLLGKAGINILTNVCGLVVVAIGTEIMFAGISPHIELFGV